MKFEVANCAVFRLCFRPIRASLCRWWCLDWWCVKTAFQCRVEGERSSKDYGGCLVIMLNNITNAGVFAYR